VIENDILSYYSMAEGRVRNEGGGFGLVMKMEYFITDHQGNTRVSFEDNGSGGVTLRQENSYYAFGMQMAGGYTPGTNPNKKLYNAGSEWQDDIEALADYYSTFFREYDPVIGRFNGVDPMSESFESWTTYHYSYNNPVNFNDPMGNRPARDNRPDPGYLLGLEMQAEYKAWHDARYGDNSSWSTVQRTMALWGWGDWSRDGNDAGGGGGGMSAFDFYGSYAGMKIRLGNYGTGAKYGYNKFGEFGYWRRVKKGYTGEETAGYGNTLGGVTVVSGKEWVSLSMPGQGFRNPFDVGLMQTGGDNKLEKVQWGLETVDQTIVTVIEQGAEAASKSTPGVSLYNKIINLTKSASRTLGVIGVGLTIYDGLKDPKGWQAKHTIDVVGGVAGTVFPPIGIVWFAGNLISLGINGKTISENIQQRIDNYKEENWSPAGMHLSFKKF
jgi:RHS repeat-associated protein